MIFFLLTATILAFNFQNRNAHQLLAANINATGNNYILIPHWGQIEAYKNKLWKDIFYYFASIFI